MKLGIIGLDWSHAVEFSRMLNDPADREHIPGYRVTAAWPGRISKDFDMSRDRMEPFTGQVSRLGVKLCGGIEEVMEQVDAVFLEQVDARLREEQLERILPFGKPVFVDKPLALSADSARRICRLARQWDCPVMSASSIRYSQGWQAALDQCRGEVEAVDVYGPMPLTPTQPGYFWYGVHMAEMLYETLGPGCQWVQARRQGDQHLITAGWQGGRLVSIRGMGPQYPDFGGALMAKGRRYCADTGRDTRGYYACLLERILKMFESGQSPVSWEQMLETTCFLEAASRSMNSGDTIWL